MRKDQNMNISDIPVGSVKKALDFPFFLQNILP